jgi:DNA replication protein DnaC
MKTSELSPLFRSLKTPAAARALPKLAQRAREESWSYERFAEALLSTEVSSRESHGGEARIKAARFPARKTLEELARFVQLQTPIAAPRRVTASCKYREGWSAR